MTKPRISAFGSVLLALATVACSHIPRATRDGKLLDVWSQISTKEYVRVRGVGAVPAGVAGSTARRGASRNAALVSARYELLALVKGIKLEGGLSIGQLMAQSNIVREIANDLVRGGEEVQTEWLSDDGVVVTLELRRSTVERLIQKDSPRERALAAEVKRLRSTREQELRTVLDFNRETSTDAYYAFLDRYVLLAKLIINTGTWLRRNEKLNKNPWFRERKMEHDVVLHNVKEAIFTYFHDCFEDGDIYRPVMLTADNLYCSGREDEVFGGVTDRVLGLWGLAPNRYMGAVRIDPDGYPILSDMEKSAGLDRDIAEEKRLNEKRIAQLAPIDLRYPYVEKPLERPGASEAAAYRNSSKSKGVTDMSADELSAYLHR